MNNASSSKNRRFRRILRVPESLESRDTPAGNITADVINGRLTIIGDAAGNGVFVGRNDSGGWVISGVNDSTGQRTSINGAESWGTSAALSGIDIHVAGGNDIVYLGHANEFNEGSPFKQNHWGNDAFGPLWEQPEFTELLGNLTINLGTGNDTAVIAATVSGGMSIYGGDDAGDDGVFIRTRDLSQESTTTKTTGKVIISLGQGNDYTAASLLGVSEAMVLASAGDDRLRVSASSDTDLSVDCDTGNDELIMGSRGIGTGGTPGFVEIYGRNGDDRIALEKVSCGLLVVWSGSGCDEISLRGVQVQGGAFIRGGETLGSSIEVLNAKFGPSLGDYYGTGYAAVDYTIPNQFESLGLEFLNRVDAPVKAPGARMSVRIESPDKETVIKNELIILGTIFEDDILIRGVQAKSLEIDSGMGADLIRAEAIKIGHDAAIRLGDGDDRGCVIGDSTYRYEPYPTGLYDTATLERIYAEADAANGTSIGGSLTVDFGAGNEIDSVAQESIGTTIAGRAFRSNRIVDPAAFATLDEAPKFVIGSVHHGYARRFRVSGMLNVRTGEGNAAVRVQAAELGGFAATLASSEQSRIAVEYVNVTGAISVFGGTADDVVSLNAFHAGGGVALHTGSGNDYVFMNRVLGLPSSIVGSLDVFSGAGDDVLDLGSGAAISVTQRVNLETDLGNDFASIVNTSAVDRLLAQLGDGDDTLALEEVTADSAGLDGGRGRNELRGLDRRRFKNVGRVNLLEIT